MLVPSKGTTSNVLHPACDPSTEHAASAFHGAVPEFLEGLLEEEEETEDDCIVILDD